MKEENEDKTDIIEIIKFLWMNKLIIFICTIIFSGISLIWLSQEPKKYKSFITIIPNQEKNISPNLGQFQQLAGSFGITTGGGNSSTAYYEDILKSRKFVEKISKTMFWNPSTQQKESLYKIFNIENGDSSVNFFNLHSILSSSLSLDTKPNGIISIYFESFSAELSANILNTLINELDIYNRTEKIIEIKESVKFIQNRVDEIKASLADNEKELRKFQEKNKDLSTPTLQLMYKNLIRKVKIYEEMYLLLAKELEMAKIQEQKEMPIVQILDKAFPPLVHSYPRGNLIFISNTVFGFLFGVVLIFLLNFLYPHIKVIRWFFKPI